MMLTLVGVPVGLADGACDGLDVGAPVGLADGAAGPVVACGPDAPGAG